MGARRIIAYLSLLALAGCAGDEVGGRSIGGGISSWNGGRAALSDEISVLQLNDGPERVACFVSHTGAGLQVLAAFDVTGDALPLGFVMRGEGARQTILVTFPDARGRSVHVQFDQRGDNDIEGRVINGGRMATEEREGALLRAAEVQAVLRRGCGAMAFREYDGLPQVRVRFHL